VGAQPQQTTAFTPNASTTLPNIGNEKSEVFISEVLQYVDQQHAILREQTEERLRVMFTNFQSILQQKKETELHPISSFPYIRSPVFSPLSLSPSVNTTMPASVTTTIPDETAPLVKRL